MWSGRLVNQALSTGHKGLRQSREPAGHQTLRALPGSEGGGGHDLVSGFGQLGEAVGQAGAGQDEGVGVEVFGLAEVVQQVQVGVRFAYPGYAG